MRSKRNFNCPLRYGVVIVIFMPYYQGQKKRMSRTRTVYSTDPDFNLRKENEKRPGSTLPAEKQTLRISLDRKQRKGKAVTLIDGFVGNEEALRALGKELKSKCGVGGTVKNGQILVQGDFREKVMAILQSGGYRTKRVGG